MEEMRVLEKHGGNPLIFKPKEKGLINISPLWN